MSVSLTEPGAYEPGSTPPATVPVGPDHVALVDVADLKHVRPFTWHLLRGHNGRLYAYASTTSRTIYMHRLISGTADGWETDHINGDGLDNRRCNLRVATRSQNSANSGKPKRPDGRPTSSRFKGVSWDKSRSRWQAKIGTLVDGRTRTRNLGRYDSEEDAARAYDAAAFAEWGPFARLNFPVQVAS